MTWSFVVILSDSADYLTGERMRLVGFHGGFATTEWMESHWHGANHASAYVAELEALFYAHWWVLCHDTSPYLHFHFDSISAGFASSGQWGFQEGNRLCVATRAHNGDPWNELADFIAQSLRDRKLEPGAQPNFEWHNLLIGSVCTPIEHLPLSFLLLRGHKSYPRGSGHEMNLVVHHSPQKQAATDALYGHLGYTHRHKIKVGQEIHRFESNAAPSTSGLSMIRQPHSQEEQLNTFARNSVQKDITSVPYRRHGQKSLSPLKQQITFVSLQLDPTEGKVASCGSAKTCLFSDKRNARSRAHSAPCKCDSFDSEATHWGGFHSCRIRRRKPSTLVQR